MSTNGMHDADCAKASNHNLACNCALVSNYAKPEMRKRFADDHFCETLRGVPIPKSSKVKKALASRCSYLMTKIQERAIAAGCERRNDFLLEELAAIVVAMEVYEAAAKEIK
jgi:hypothetical protein